MERKIISHMIFNKESHLGYLVFTIRKTWGEIKYLTSSMVKG